MSHTDDYWRDAVAYALEDLGKYDLFTSEELDTLGSSLATSADNYSDFSPPVSNPMEYEMRQVKQRHAEELKDRDRREQALEEERKEAWRRADRLAYDLETERRKQ